MKRTLANFSAAMGGTLVGRDVAFSAISTDTRTLAAGELFVALSGPNFDAHDFIAAAIGRGAVGAVVTRRLHAALPQIVVDDALVALQRAAAAWRSQFSIPVVAVAGSNGKTTTKELIGAVLAGQGPCLATRGTLNNHIGVPLTLLGLEPHHRTAVIEIGANHPGEVADLVAIVRPTVGIVTNAGAEHLEGFGSLEGVAHAEGELYAGLAPDATAIINTDDAYAALWTEMNGAGRRLCFGITGDADFRVAGAIEANGANDVSQRFELVTPAGRADVRLLLAGRHNVVNALGAAAAAHAAGADLAAIASGLGQTKPVRGRLELHPALRGARVLDDSYNANPSSLTAGLGVLGSLSGESWLVLGDMAELGEASRDAHVSAGREARAAGVTRLYAVGELAAKAVEAFGAGGQWFPDVEALTAALVPSLRPGVTVLVKGSRMNRLERVVGALRGASDAPAAQGH